MNERTQPRFDVSTGGELLGVLSATETGPLESVSALHKGTGGAVVNVAIVVAGLGLGVTLWGAVGDDPIGREGLDRLRQAGVDTAAVVVDAEHPTGIYLKERRVAAATTAHYYRAGSAAAHLRFADLDLDHVPTAACSTSPGSPPHSLAATTSCASCSSRPNADASS